MASAITAPATNIVRALGQWYVANHRELPWRAAPGQGNDPYRVWLSEIMLQQTTVRAVIPYFLTFTQTWPNVAAMAAAPLEDILHAWAGLGYYARARNLHKCAQAVVNEHNGQFPTTYNALLKLPGIGPYTAGAICAIAYQTPAPVMDGNIERVVSRLLAIADALPEAKPIYRDAVADLFTPQRLSAANTPPGDLAQAMMDLGATICTPTKPACAQCPANAHCLGHIQGMAENFPVKAAKKATPARHGYVFWITDKATGRVLTENRPEKGLLGGMRGLPTSAWIDAGDSTLPEIPAYLPLTLHDSGLQARHVFTHFSLKLQIFTAETSSPETNCLELPASMEWLTPDLRWRNSLPTLFRKVADLMKR